MSENVVEESEEPLGFVLICFKVLLVDGFFGCALVVLFFLGGGLRGTCSWEEGLGLKIARRLCHVCSLKVLVLLFT